ncbi:MAG: UDP-N-acetylmuramate dehydrogenase [Patescibacteria group bacterium]|nr:UDP-N-acetylmuramate dehydrogenase [Patescibacteria group bacterium]
MDLLTLQHEISPNIKADEPMAPHTTFRIGGPAEFFLEAETADEAARAVAACRELKLPYFVLGGGSNILVSDEGVKGLVILMANRGFKIDGPVVTVEAGAPTALLALKSVEAGLAGLEWAAGLPGTIGGAIRGNAGMFGGEMKDSIESVRVLMDKEDRVLNNAECEFGYRDSVFKRKPGVVILSAVLRLAPAENPAAAKAKLAENVKKKAAAQPLNEFSAGCAFKNWQSLDPEKDMPVLRKSLDLNKDEIIPFSPSGTLPAGWIIDRAQLKGMKMGHCAVSEKHANFIVCDGHGTASEVIALTAAIKMKVRDMTHGIVELNEEIEYVGF